MKITLTSDTSLRLEPTAGPMTIDAPSADQQFSPFHMLASGLAYCTYSILASWATHVGVGTDALAVDVEWSFAEGPHRVGAMRVTYSWPELPENRRAAAKRAAALCAVHATLTHSPTITIEQGAVGAAAPTAAPTAPAAASAVTPGDVAASEVGVAQPPGAPGAAAR
ncbi:MAG: OsmC family protein [Gemmatimonadaceae bacterium]